MKMATLDLTMGRQINLLDFQSDCKFILLLSLALLRYNLQMRVAYVYSIQHDVLICCIYREMITTIKLISLSHLT